MDAVDRAFPFADYREYQEETLRAAHNHLRDGKETVIIDAPTGIGKSGINMALCNLWGPAFYTTPQKQLRDQLQADETLKPYHSSLKGREDYRCPVGSARREEPRNCKDCPINRTENKSCRNHACPYWGDKEEAMDADAATITFSYLIIDDRIDKYAEDAKSDTEQGQTGLSDFDSEKTQISFGDRQLLVVDEAHQLEEQVASLHAGFTLSPRTLSTASLDNYVENGSASVSADAPENVYTVFNDRLRELLPDKSYSDETLVVADVRPAIEALAKAVKAKAREIERIEHPNKDGIKAKNRLKSLKWKLENLTKALDQGREWVASVSDGPDTKTKFRLDAQPVKVDRFLQNYVWNRAAKVVLSTATMPYRNNPDAWLERIGLEPRDAAVVSQPMPFDASNRQIRTGVAVDKLSQGTEYDVWDGLVNRVRGIADHHTGDKGLIHTVSYDRAERLHESLPERTVLHNSSEDNNVAIARWQNSDKQALLTPSMMQGVDLDGDTCRWQVLLKAPYPNLSDPRVEYLIDEAGDWEWYKDVTAREIIQSVGRAVRSKNDHAMYYVLDKSYFDIMRGGRAPDWFKAAEH